MAGVREDCECGPESNCTFKADGWLNPKMIKECICKPGYTDKNGICFGPCTDNPCKNGGTCQDVKNGYNCLCPTRYKGKNCQEKELDKCLQQRIKGNCSSDHETCDKKGDCICERYYAYNEDKSACEADFCGKKSISPCGANMDCIEGHESYSCVCEEGFRQFGGKCVAIDKCAPGISNCEQMCTKGNCECSMLFKLNDDGYTCDPKTPPQDCSLNCTKGTCIKEKTERCICPQISHVYRKNTCIDKCEAGLVKENECPIGCISDEHMGYKCNCTGKYEYEEDGVHCKAKDMCKDGGGDEDCLSKGGHCRESFDLPEGYECECEFGYGRDKLTGQCIHKCVVADCEKKQAFCIINVNNNAECICPPLLIKDSNGRCSELAKYSFLGEFSVPKSRYEVISTENKNRIKRDLQNEMNYGKLLKNFDDSMKNIFGESKGASIVNCTDDVSDWKCFMEIKLNNDPGDKISIISTPSVCISLLDESECLLQPDFIIRKRPVNDDEVFHKTKKCDKSVISNMCGDDTVCTETTPGFKCECKPGYVRRTSFVPARDVLVDLCEDMDECLNPAICPDTTTCFNLPGDYTCHCIEGHRLETGKSLKKDGCRAVCDPNPCVYGTCSAIGKDGFSCCCDGLHTGRFCNQTNEVITGLKKKGKQTAGIVGGVLGAFLVVAIIISIIFFRRLKMQKPCDDTQEYIKQRKRGLESEMKRLDKKQPENEYVELKEHERKPKNAFENPKYSSQYSTNPIDSMSNSSPYIGRSANKTVNGLDISDKLENGDYRKGCTDDDKMVANSRPSHHSVKESRQKSRKDDERKEQSLKYLPKLSNNSNDEKTGVSRM